MTKKKAVYIILTVIFCICMTMLEPVVVGATSMSSITSESIRDMQNQIKNAERERQELKASLTDIKNMVKRLEKEKKNLNNYVSQLDANLSAIETKIADLANQIVLKELKIVETQAMLDEARKVEVAQHQSMDSRIRIFYEKGTNYYWEMLLAATSFGDLLNKMIYINALATYDRKMLDDYVTNREYIELCERQLNEEKALLDETKAGVEQEQQALEVLIAEKKNEIEKYETSIETQEQAIKEYEEYIAEQNEIISQLEKAVEEEKKKILAQNGLVLTYDGGTFAFPMKSYTRISSDYGYRIHPTLNVNKFHNGVDFAAPKGTPIYAAYDGIVVAATYSATMGNYVMINHGNGLYTIYMHASKLHVSANDVVVKGETIAEVGTTGRSTGNHLHFSVRRDGQYVSPWEYITVP